MFTLPLSLSGVKACLEAVEPVNEMPYEITRDIHGCFSGPQRGRMRVMAKVCYLVTCLKYLNQSVSCVPCKSDFISRDAVLGKG